MIRVNLSIIVVFESPQISNYMFYFFKIFFWIQLFVTCSPLSSTSGNDTKRNVNLCEHSARPNSNISPLLRDWPRVSSQQPKRRELDARYLSEQDSKRILKGMASVLRSRASSIVSPSAVRRRLPLVGAFCVLSFGLSNLCSSFLLTSKTGCAQSLCFAPLLR